MTLTLKSVLDQDPLGLRSSLKWFSYFLYAGMTLAQLTVPALPAPAPQYQYRLVSPMPIATPDQKKPLA